MGKADLNHCTCALGLRRERAIEFVPQHPLVHIVAVSRWVGPFHSSVAFIAISCKKADL